MIDFALVGQLALFILALMAAPFILYVVARLIFTAYFFTREQFRRTKNGQR